MTNEPQPTYNIVPTIQPRAQSKGFLPWLHDAFFGKRDAHADAIKEQQRHGGGFRAFSRFISYVMLIAFSAQGVMAQVRPDALAVFAALQRGEWPDINQILTVFVVVVFILGCDLTIIAMSEYIRHKLIQGVSLGELWWALLLVIFPGGIEACTYIKIIVETETPRNLLDWGLLIARAFFLPVVVVVLATLRAMPFTVTDYKQSEAVRLSLHVIDYVNHMLGQIDPREIDGGALISAYASVNDLTPAQAEQMQHHAASIAALIPNNANARKQAEQEAIQREHATEIEKIQAAYQQQFTAYSNEKAHLLERLSSLETAVNDARIAAQTARHEAGIQADSELGNTLQKVLLSLAYQQRLPDDIVERYPELSDLNVESMFQQSRKNSRDNAQAKSTKETPDNAEGQRAFLRRIIGNPDAIAKMIGTPNGRKGVWITAPVLQVLSGDKIALPAAQDIVKLLNKGDKSAKIGTSNAAPFVDVMRYLSGLGALSDEARTFWQSSEDSTEDAVPLRVVQ